MHLRETGYEDVDWIHLAQNGVQWQTLVDTVMDCQIPKTEQSIFD
jgi:hypothetical protein